MSGESETATCYTIRRLQWSGYFGGDIEAYSAMTVFGDLTIKRYKDVSTNTWRPWTWGCHFDDAVATKRQICDTAEQGMKLAEEKWIGLLETFLKKSV